MDLEMGIVFFNERNCSLRRGSSEKNDQWTNEMDRFREMKNYRFFLNEGKK